MVFGDFLYGNNDIENVKVSLNDIAFTITVTCKLNKFFSVLKYFNKNCKQDELKKDCYFVKKRNGFVEYRYMKYAFTKKEDCFEKRKYKKSSICTYEIRYDIENDFGNKINLIFIGNQF